MQNYLCMRYVRFLSCKWNTINKHSYREHGLYKTPIIASFIRLDNSFAREKGMNGLIAQFGKLSNETFDISN